MKTPEEMQRLYTSRLFEAAHEAAVLYPVRSSTSCYEQAINSLASVMNEIAREGYTFTIAVSAQDPTARGIMFSQMPEEEHKKVLAMWQARKVET